MPDERREDTATVDSHDQIVHTCEMYMQGGERGDAALLRRAFRPDARVYGEAGGRRMDVPIEKFIEIACEAPVGRGGRYRGRVLAVHATKDAAIAVIAEDGCWGAVSFIDYLSLVRVGTDWKIAAKVFALTGGTIPP